MAGLVRVATTADLERVAEIKVRNWADTYAALIDPATLAPFLDYDTQLVAMREVMESAASLVLVAEDGSRTVHGFALTYPDHEPEPWLESLHIIRDQRSRGLGTALMRATARELQGRGHHSLRLGVVEGNASAARFYERLGATLVGREPADWADAVWHEIYRWPDLAVLV